MRELNGRQRRERLAGPQSLHFGLPIRVGLVEGKRLDIDAGERTLIQTTRIDANTAALNGDTEFTAAVFW